MPDKETKNAVSYEWAKTKTRGHKMPLRYATSQVMMLTSRLLAFFAPCLLWRIKGEKKVVFTHQASLWLDQWPVLAVHLVVEPAGVAEVVAVPVATPQRGRCRPAIHTLSSF